MDDLNLLGADGGRLAAAFSAGCVATAAFMSGIGTFIWKAVGGQRQDRIAELAKDLATERANCREMEQRLIRRIEQLEMMWNVETGRHAVTTTFRAVEIESRDDER